jgi:hypothetical protein
MAASAESIRESNPKAARLHIVIFSKDRACQVDSLLRSVHDHFKTGDCAITVLFRTTTQAFHDGYEIVKSRAIVDKITWRPEKKFPDDVRDIVGGLDNDSFVMFLVDDTIIFRPCVLSHVLDAFTDRHLFVSLRASRTYPADVPPKFISDGAFLEWKWNYSKRKWVTWNYPFSVDGNIFHVRHMKKVVDKISFEAPNSFEGRMHTCRHAWWIKRITRALALPAAVVFNNPLNRVQVEGETWHNNITPEHLNDRYLAGMKIDNSVLYCAVPTATHFAVPLSFEEK